MSKKITPLQELSTKELENLRKEVSDAINEGSAKGDTLSMLINKKRSINAELSTRSDRDIPSKPETKEQSTVTSVSTQELKAYIDEQFKELPQSLGLEQVKAIVEEFLSPINALAEQIRAKHEELENKINEIADELFSEINPKN